MRFSHLIASDRHGFQSPRAVISICNDAVALWFAISGVGFIGYYALARIDEVLSVRLCDLALLGPEPYLEIREGKGGKARRVYLTHAPMAFIAWSSLKMNSTLGRCG